jgi:hypothetical protein
VANKKDFDLGTRATLLDLLETMVGVVHINKTSNTPMVVHTATTTNISNITRHLHHRYTNKQVMTFIT